MNELLNKFNNVGLKFLGKLFFIALNFQVELYIHSAYSIANNTIFFLLLLLCYIMPNGNFGIDDFVSLTMDFWLVECLAIFINQFSRHLGKMPNQYFFSCLVFV